MALTEDDVLMEYMQEIFSDRDGLKRCVEYLINRAMRHELTEHIKAGRYKRDASRRGHRNGYKSRTLSTRVGQLHLEIPQARNSRPYHPSMLTRYRRSERALLVACAEMYFQGVSTRKVKDVLESMCGTQISSSAVSSVAQELDCILEPFANRRLDEDEYPFLIIDARYEKVRVEGKIVSQAVLVAVGVNTQGMRRVLDWRVCDSESLQSWGEMFKDFKKRGLRGLELVVSDAHEGIRAAINKYFQGVVWQRCRVHFKRELMKKVPRKLYRELLDELSQAYQAKTTKDSMAACMSMADRWRQRYPAVCKMLEEGFEDTLAVNDMPVDIRSKLQSTNMLESIMKRLKRRTRVVQIFPNRKSCWRLVGAQLVELDEDWLTGPTYIAGLQNYYLEM